MLPCLHLLAFALSVSDGLVARYLLDGHIIKLNVRGIAPPLLLTAFSAFFAALFWCRTLSTFASHDISFLTWIPLRVR
jgi:hypothetical protein